MSLSDEHPEFFNNNHGDDEKPVEKVFKPYKNNEIDPVKSAIRTYNETIKLNGVPAVIGCIGPDQDGEFNLVCSMEGKFIYNISAAFKGQLDFVKALRGIANILEAKLNEE